MHFALFSDVTSRMIWFVAQTVTQNTYVVGYYHFYQCACIFFTLSINQSINFYRTIVQRSVLQCGYAESKRNVLRRMLNVLMDGAVRQFSGREFQIPNSRSSNRETTCRVADFND